MSSLRGDAWALPIESLARITPQEARAVRLARRAARRSVVDFRRYVRPHLLVGRHHELVGAALERVLCGELQLLIIKAPPRHGKSEQVSIEFPAYVLGRHPDWQLAWACYDQELARTFGRTVRTVVRSKRYQMVFPHVVVSSESSAADEFRLTSGGVYIARGIKGGATGYGGHIFGIDDPIKDQAEAFSETVRESHWQWFQSVVWSRKMQDVAHGFRGAIVLAYTQWHEDDVGGRMEKELLQLFGDRALVVRIPCEAEENDPLGREVGEPLWPERGYDREWMEMTKSVVGPVFWNAQYQGNPLPEGGTYFQADWFREYEPEELPRRLYMYGSSDYATADEDGLDETMHAVWGVDHTGDAWVVDVFWDRADTDVWVEAWCDLVVKHKPLCWFEEKGQILKSVGPWLLKRMQERNIFCRREQYTSANSKAIRARSYQAAMSQGRVHVPKRAPWAAKWKSQHLKFPGGKHDESIDVGSLFYRGYEDQIRPPVGQAPAPQSAQMDASPWGRNR